MSDDLFAEVKGEGATLDIDKAFERLEEKGETPSEASTEKPEEKTPDSSKDSGKWAEMRKAVKRAEEAAAKATADAEAIRKGSEPVTVPNWFGRFEKETDEQRLERFKAIVAKDGELDWIKQQVQADLEAKMQAEEQSKATGKAYVDGQVAEMKEEGLKFEENALMKFMVDFQKEFGAGSLLDEQGNYDLRKALTMMQRFNPEEEEENVNKSLAAQASKSKVNSPSTSKIPVVSRRTLRRGWRDAGI